MTGKYIKYIKHKCSRDLPPEDFHKILYDGFYYKEGKEIYYERNAIFIGNGFCDRMIRTHFLHSQWSGELLLEDSHFFDWAKRDDVWKFDDYGVTWSVRREDLE